MVHMPDRLVVDVTINPTINPLVKAKTKDGWVVIAEWISTENGLTIVPRDEHHTMPELYEYRMLYNAHAVNEWAKHGTYPVVKSWRHSDGEECFGGGWFIVVATLSTGQVSNHYEKKHWELFKVPEVEFAPEYDGHTPEEAAERLFLALIPEDWNEL